MHQYLKAIGFSNITTRQQERELLKEIEEDFSSHTLAELTKDCDFCEFVREYGIGIGVKSCGEINDWDEFEREYYFPYFEGSGITTYTDVVVERRIDTEKYVGVCEDARVGVMLIFHVKNGFEYMKECQHRSKSEMRTSVTFSGLALSGKILLPVRKSEEQVKNEQKKYQERNILLNAAKSGDQGAIETLTRDDMDTYSKISQRLIYEDVFTIVDSYFMPYGVECDLYSVMGEILAVRERENIYTNEIVYQMKLNVNELVFDICVPKAEVLGEPEIGRRFKGTIWLQGKINF